jgi:O-antigen ligase
VTRWALALPLWLAALAPGLLALNLPPSATVFNQAAAWLAWGLVAVYGVRSVLQPARAAAQLASPLLLALTLLALSALASWGLGELPAALAGSNAGTLAAAALVALLGAGMARQPGLAGLWFGAWLAAGLVSALLGCIQVLAPEWADGDFIARTGAGGRASGNLRQPNHLASLLLWGVVALVPLVESGAWSRTALRRAGAVAAMALLMLALMLTGSRTGVVGVVVLTGWALLDRRLSGFSRALLGAAPLMFGAAWLLVDWASAGPAVGAAQRLGQSDLSTGRWAIWRDTLALIAAHPLSGVGYGEFNLAWTLTPFPERSPQFFDHTHNLPLQLLVELGLPLGGAVLWLLLWALWQAWTRVRLSHGDDGPAARALFVMVLLMGVHSQFEYPLWYAHFLLPTAFAWGACLGLSAPAHATQPWRWPLAAGVALVLGASVMVWDFKRVSAIFQPADDGATLVERIHEGQRSWFFAHHADYARITALDDALPPASAEFRRASHYLLDTRLLAAWSNAYAREGDLERARWVADRLRELQQDAAEPYFAPCADAASAVKPHQCTAAARAFTWQDFR